MLSLTITRLNMMLKIPDRSGTGSSPLWLLRPIKHVALVILRDAYTLRLHFHRSILLLARDEC
jgi:hypothetical protein